MANVDFVLIIRTLVEMVDHGGDWQCRHGGLLGLKHLLPTKPNLLPSVLPAIDNAMTDCIDDVVGAAAGALVSVAKYLSEDSASTLVRHLMEALKDLDDLSSSTSPVLQLLSTLIAQCPSATYIGTISAIIPRLVPFLHHHSSGVRLSALQTFDTLTTSREVASVFLKEHCSTIMQV